MYAQIKLGSVKVLERPPFWENAAPSVNHNISRVMRKPVFSSPEPLGPHGELIVYPSSRRPSVFQRSSSLKPTGQSKTNFIWSLLGKGEPKFI